MGLIEGLYLDGLSLNGRTSYVDAVNTDGPLSYLRMPDTAGTAATNAASTGYSTNVRAAILALSPAIFWRLNETAGGTATDSSGNGRNGTYSGITLNQTAIVPGDPSPDVCINVPNSGSVGSTYSPAPLGGEVRTWMGFFKRTNTVDNDVYFGATGGSGGYGLFIAAGSSNVTFQTYSGANVTWTGVGGAVNSIHHVALVYDDTADIAELFVDGLSCGTKNFNAGGTGANTLTVGSGVNGTPWTGNISEFALFERALTPAEIARVASYMYVWTYGSGLTLNQTSLLVGDTADRSILSHAGSSNDKISANLQPFQASGIGSFTVEALVNRNGDSTSQMALCSAGGSGVGMVIKDQPGSGGLYMGVNEGSVTGVTWGNGTIPSTGIHHLVVTYNNVTFTAEAFVDGVSKGTRTFSSGLNNLAAMEFARSVDGGFSRSWGGPFDEAVLYNGILSAARIQAHYVASLTNPCDFILQGYEVPPPNKRTEWAQGADVDGAVLVRDPLCDNREVTLRLRVRQQASMDAALAQIAVLSKKLEEAEQQRDGLAMVWQPANSTKTMTMYVLSGTIDSLPITKDSGDDLGWLLPQPAPVFTVKMTCKPFGYGSPVTFSSASSATPFVTTTLTGVGGDVPAEVRLLITEAASQDRRYLEAGLQWRYTDLATSFLVDSDDMVTSGFNGTQTTRSGAYDPNASGNNVIRQTTTSTTVAICGTGNLSHVGTFRVKARIFVSAISAIDSSDQSSKLKLRLTWQDGDGPFRANSFVNATIQGVFMEVDLGLINITEKVLGTQRWQGRLEAYTTNNPGTDTIDIDYLLLIPAGEFYGRARGEFTAADTPNTYTARDEFDQTAGAIAGKTAPVGGNWSSAGDTTDLAVVAGSTHQLNRTVNLTESVGRFATIGSSVTTQAVQADIILAGDLSNDQRGGVCLRFSGTTPTHNALIAYCDQIPAVIAVAKIVGGSTTVLATYSVPSGFLGASLRWALRLAADTTGRWWLFGSNKGAFKLLLKGQDAVLATGGSLQTGTVGIFDRNVTLNGTFSPSRSYDNFQAWLPAPQAVIYSGRVGELRSDGAKRQDSTGVYYGDMPAYRGGRMLVPPAGDENRATRIFCKAHRGDIEAEPADQVTDNLTIQAVVTPRYMVVPF